MIRPGNEECLIRDLEVTNAKQDANNSTRRTEHKTKVNVIFVNSLYSSTETPQLDVLYNALTEDGVLVINSDIASYSQKLQDIGFKSIHIYGEVRRFQLHISVIFTHVFIIAIYYLQCHFPNQLQQLCKSATHSFAVAFKDYRTRSKWYRNEAEIQVEMHQHFQKTRSTEDTLFHFDATVMLSYQIPSKDSEISFCRDNEDECDGNFNLPPDTNLIPAFQIKVGPSKISKFAGRGLFAAEDIPPHSVIALDLQVNNFHILPSTWEIVESMYQNNMRSMINDGLLQGLLYFIQGKVAKKCNTLISIISRDPKHTPPCSFFSIYRLWLW